MQQPVDSKATPEARALLNYLSQVGGHGILTGQHTQTNPMEEIDWIFRHTGKKPALRGFEMLAYSPNINEDDASEACLTEVRENRGTMETARRWAREEKGIVTLSFHWFSPMGGRDKSFYAEHTDFDPERVPLEGSDERAAFYHDMDAIAGELQKFQDEHIPVLWRPFHESYGTWFWWGRKGPVVASKLYGLMFDYYTQVKGLHNLLWVWNCPAREAYPGDDRVDVVSVDVYLPEYAPTDYAESYRELAAGTSKNKVAALAEVGYLPDISALEKSRIPWAYYMTWSKEFCIGEQYNSVENLKAMYHSPYAVTADSSEKN